ncbi:MAG: HPr family phosphocarrier protein [Pirellulaceae bacterium]|jgi:phosphotransferase system HPr (HPr) family protein|nr:HPr family phosphocarrier protein [Pirellulaceae bacterium]MDP7304654.1 HPr family phosphocarrier protein [Pirellulaceae bacterium]HJN11758.1 HPr family phosphocarrier protein [Pirellulaceae bacterium]
MNDKVSTRQVKVSNPQGLHARPAHALVSLANQFQAEIDVIRDHERVDGKSILSILTLAAEQGTVLIIEARGEDAKDALDALEHLFLDGFGDTASSDDKETSQTDGTQRPSR